MSPPPSTPAPLEADVVTPAPTAATATSATIVPPSSSGATPAPTDSSTSARDLDLTPSPTTTTAAVSAPVGSGPSSEGTTSTTDIGGVDSSRDVCDIALGCGDDEECLQCITGAVTAEYEDCLEGDIQDTCEALFLPLCCAAAVSGNDCMANDIFVALLECYIAEVDECSFDEDSTCSAATSAAVEDNSAGPVVATAISYSRGVLTFALGLAAVVATML